MKSPRRTNKELNKYISAVAAGRSYWNDTTAKSTAIHRRVKRLYTARGWPWPKHWTGAGRRSIWYARAGSTVDVYGGGGTEPQTKGAK